MAETIQYGAHSTADRAGNGIDILAGAWLILAPFVLGFSGSVGAMWNAIIVGAAIVILSLMSFSAKSAATRWINGLLGAWLFFSPFILGFSDSSVILWNSLVTGAVVVIFSVWSAVNVSSEQARGY